MKAITKYLSLLVFLFVSLTLHAQPPKNNTGKPAVQKFKPPKLFTSIGNRSDSVLVSREEALALLAQTLQVHDEKKAAYTLSSYQFLYRRREVKEDDDMSGKTTPTSSIVTDLFKTTPLPDIWIRNLTDQLQPGEELLFYDVIAKDASGRLMFAPTLKIKVK